MDILIFDLDRVIVVVSVAHLGGGIIGGDREKGFLEKGCETCPGRDEMASFAS